MTVVALTFAASCCDWTAHGAAADREAAKHTDKHGHATLSWAEPTPPTEETKP